MGHRRPARGRSPGMVPLHPSEGAGRGGHQGEGSRSDRPAGPHGRTGGNVYSDPGTGRSGFRALPPAGMTSATGSRLQGRDDIVVDAPIQILWELISDSYEL